MYQCDECKKTFEANEIERWVDERVGDSCLYSYHCPHCKSEEFGEVVECSRCGQEWNENELSYGLCPDCQKEIDERVRNFFKDMTNDEIDYIFEFFDDIMMGV